MKRYLVTGGSGFIGSALVRRLLADGHEVQVLDDGSRGRARRLEDVRPHIDVIDADVRDPVAVARACERVDAICHLAAVNGTEHFYSIPEVVLDVGVRGMLNVLNGAAAAGVGEVFLASSSEVYQMPPIIPTPETVSLVIPDPLNPRYSYAGSKIISELLMVNMGRKMLRRAVIFRPHNVYGPDMGWEHVIPQLSLRLRQLAQSSVGTIRLPIQGTGDETRAFAYVDDAIDGIVRVMDHGEHLGIYNVGNDEEVTIASLARAIGTCLGRPVEVLAGEGAAGSAPRRCPDITKLRALGYRPQVSLGDGLERTVRWYDTNADLQPGDRRSPTWNR